MPFLIDGYNVYHAAGKLYEQWSHSAPATLCELIAEDMRRMKDRATIVFDGVRPRDFSGHIEPAGFVKILFSGPDSDADSVLEKLIKKNTAPRRLQVVSSDNAVRRMARRRRSVSLTSQDYLLGLKIRQEQPPPPPPEPREKLRGVPEGELGTWLELFGIDPDEKGDETGMIEF